MNAGIPRLRMFAGPNGSGKSTLKSILRPELIGRYLNPDEIESELNSKRSIDLSQYGISSSLEEIRAFFSALPDGERSKKRFPHVANGIDYDGIVIRFESLEGNSYLASELAEFLRMKLIEASASFTFETVMSHPSKIDILRTAREKGYRTYLYFIATDDPDINVSRVKNRVRLGGHSVAEEKIKERYFRSLGHLADAIRNSNRAYIFDNSTEGNEKTWIAEISDGKDLEIKADHPPAWFRKYVWDKFVPF